MIAHRIAVWRDTRDYSDCLMPPQPSVKFCYKTDEAWAKSPVGMKVLVKDVDCLTACKDLILAGCNPVIHSLANMLVPGGDVSSGSGGQEESIFRRTNVIRTLAKSFFPSKFTCKTPDRQLHVQVFH